MEKINENTTRESSKKYGLNDYIEYYKKGVHFVFENWRGGYKNRVTGLSYLGLICSDDFSTKSLFISYLLLTSFGFTAEKIYKRTKEHIEKYGSLDSRFFVGVIQNDKNNPFVGYCQLQGMYLAAKEFGLEEDFFRMKKELTKNKIPNF